MHFITNYSNPAHGVHVYDKSNDNFDFFKYYIHDFFLCTFAIEHSLLKISMNRCDAFDISTLEICFILMVTIALILR